MEERKRMRKRITLLIAALMLALTMSLGGAGAAFAEKCRGEDIKPNQTCVKGGGPPQVQNSGGNFPPGQQPSPGNSGG
jgi:hypothetical protein